MQTPLFGKKVVITRARHQSGPFVQAIAQLGGDAVLCPVIATVAITTDAAMGVYHQVLQCLESYDAVLFASANGVKYFFETCEQLQTDVQRLRSARMYAVGPKTADALRSRGWSVEPLPIHYQASELANTLLKQQRGKLRLLLPRALFARPELPELLRLQGHDVVELPVYETVPSEEGLAQTIQLLYEGKIDFVTFTSPSTVRNLVVLLRNNGIANPQSVLQVPKIVCIGPVTAQAAIEIGLQVNAVAAQSTIESLITTLLEINT
jgi:uroporphyrinogen III methyltransferase/synthase